MRRIFGFCAVAAIGFTALAASSPANAAYHLIRWQDTGFCQIWDESIPTTPWPAGYHRASASVPTFVDALMVKDAALKSGSCKW
jgi:hypothetical protein